MSTQRRLGLAMVMILCGAKALMHLALANRYGYHGDELYFLECGRRFAFGYVDHPPLIPWIARLIDELGGGLVALRIPAIACATGTMAFTSLLVREWGGGSRAQLLALLTLLVAPANLRMGAMLNIPVVEGFLCTVAAYLVARALRSGERWPWVAAGGALGFAILAKHSSVLWGVALVTGILATPSRRVLASRWPWIGVAIVCIVVMPNVIWQVDHNFVSLEFMRTLRHEVLTEQGRGLFVAGQFLYFHPLAIPIWIAGLGLAFTATGQAVRPFAVLWLSMFAVLFIVGGKPYYLASAYPAVLAAGGVAVESWLAQRIAALRALVATLVVTGAGLALITLPILPLRTVDAAIGALLGWAVRPIDLTHDLHGMYGWQEHASTIEGVYQSLAATERGQATILTGTYSQASAINVLRDEAAPRAVSGNMSYYLWGPDGDRGDVLIAYGLPLSIIARHYGTCREVARIHAPLARPWDSELPVYVCREPHGTMADLWPEVRRFGHLLPTPPGWPGQPDPSDAK